MAAEPERKVGPMPSGRRWRGLPVPGWFAENSTTAFRSLEAREDDVFMVSLPKSGTTWVNTILHLLLRGIDDEGNAVPGAKEMAGGAIQVYPEGTPMRGEEEPPETRQMRSVFFGDWTYEDLVEQPAPRIFSTHLPAEFLPEQITSPEGKGRLVIVLRNLKDVLTSLHFFRGEAKDGWLGNEHGPGSFARFTHPDCPNAYGSMFKWVREMDALASSLLPTGRVCVLYYEALKRRLPAELARLSNFLGLPLSQKKLEAVANAVSFDAVKKSGMQGSILLRKGDIGDWKNHLDDERWSEFDQIFDERLGGVKMAEPMRSFQAKEVTGLPLPRAEQTLQTDPREWPKFVRATLEDGNLVRDGLVGAAAQTGSGTFKRPPSEFLGTVVPPGTPGAEFEAEAGRYHLFVSGVCPWASGVRAVRRLMGLEEVVSMDIADGQSSAGWVFLSGTETCAPWADRPGPLYLHEVYQAHDTAVTARITVPVLWDKQRQCIVSNDSWSIVKMLASAFRPLGQSNCELLPPALADDIEECQRMLYGGLLNGVYRAGIALFRGNSAGAAEAAEEVYSALDRTEQLLSQRRFLVGTDLTVVDVRLAMTLLRWDAAYRFAFGLTGGQGGVLVGKGYPALAGFVRDVYARIAPEVDWSSIRQYFRWAVGLAPGEALPDLMELKDSAAAPHSRSAL